MSSDHLDNFEVFVYKFVGVFSFIKVIYGVNLISETGTAIGVNFFLASILNYLYDIAYTYFYCKDQLHKIIEPNLAILRYIIFTLNILHSCYTTNSKLFVFNVLSLIIYTCTLANELLEKDIPKLKFNKCCQKDIKFSETCSICLEENIQDITKLKCEHVFHIKCIESYAKISGKNFCCPTCRKQVI